MGDDHRDDGDRGDRAAGGLPPAGGDGGPERLRVGVQRPLSRSDLGRRNHSPSRRLTGDADRGSAVAEFALVLVLLLLLFLALVSVGLWAYTRTLLTSAAADAARVAASYDASAEAATARVGELLGDGLTGATRSTLACTSGIQGLLVTVQCTMEAPGIVGLLDGVMPTVEVTGHSAKETIG
ncbi:MAG TPA: TadE/TadG family type IV pilus assembly protein [Nakamurella sp.]